MIASAQSPKPAGVAVIGEIAQDYGWKLLASGKQGLKVVWWPRLLERLSGKLDGQPVLVPVSTWDQSRRSLVKAPLHVHWQVLFSTTRRLAVLCGRTCGRSGVKAAASHRGRCFC